MVDISTTTNASSSGTYKELFPWYTTAARNALIEGRKVSPYTHKLFWTSCAQALVDHLPFLMRFDRNIARPSIDIMRDRRAADVWKEALN